MVGMSVRGQVHLYTGNGKGKTTAAIGLTIRAAGAGKKVLFSQFVKGMEYHEIEVLKSLGGLITFRNYGRGCFFQRGIEPEDHVAARAGYDDLISMMNHLPAFDMIVTDELTIALYHQLLSIGQVIGLIKQKPENTELIITGRYAPQELIDAADLITEMKEVRHYYQNGLIPAREGIEF